MLVELSLVSAWASLDGGRERAANTGGWIGTGKYLGVVIGGPWWAIGNLNVARIAARKICCEEGDIILNINWKLENTFLEIVYPWPVYRLICVSIVCLIDDILCVALGEVNSFLQVTVEYQGSNRDGESEETHNQKYSDHGPKTADIVSGRIDLITTATKLSGCLLFAASVEADDLDDGGNKNGQGHAGHREQRGGKWCQGQ